MNQSAFQLTLASCAKVRLKSFSRELKRCSQKPSEKRVHMLRIAARRLIAILAILEELIGRDKRLREMRKSAKRALKILGSLRDIQIQQEYLVDLSTTFPELEKYIGHLTIRESIEVKKAAKQLKHDDFDVSSFFLIKINKKLGVQKMSVQTVIGLLNARYETLIELNEAITPENSETIHLTRIAFKNFRYAWEIFHSLLPSGLSTREEDFQIIQGSMGKIQDLVVLQSGLSDFMQAHNSASHDAISMDQLNALKEAAIADFMRARPLIHKLWPLRIALRA